METTTQVATTSNVADNLIEGALANASNGVTISISRKPIQFSRMYQAAFQKEGTKTVELKQSIVKKSSYPSKKVENEMQQTFAPVADFGFATQDFESTETRVTWVAVPDKYTEQQAKDLIETSNKSGACIYRVLSNEPILADDQLYAIAQGLKTKDDFAKSQAVRYPENTIKNGVNVSGMLILDQNNNVQYKKNYYWKTSREDVDLRGKSDIYVPVELQAELNGASSIHGQTL